MRCVHIPTATRLPASSLTSASLTPVCLPRWMTRPSQARVPSFRLEVGDVIDPQVHRHADLARLEQSPERYTAGGVQDGCRDSAVQHTVESVHLLGCLQGYPRAPFSGVLNLHPHMTIHG